MGTIINMYNELLSNKETMNQLHERDFKTFEEYEVYHNEIQSLYNKQNNLIKELYNTINKNIQLFYKTTYKTGVVWTKFQEDILKGKFIIWIDKDYTINHKFFNLIEGTI